MKLCHLVTFLVLIHTELKAQNIYSDVELIDLTYHGIPRQPLRSCPGLNYGSEGAYLNGKVKVKKLNLIGAIDTLGHGRIGCH